MAFSIKPDAHCDIVHSAAPPKNIHKVHNKIPLSNIFVSFCSPPKPSIGGSSDFKNIKKAIKGTIAQSNARYIQFRLPKTDKNNDNHKSGLMESMTFYCGEIGDFRWAFAVSGVGMGASNINVCTSDDGGKNWYVDNTNYIRKRTIIVCFFCFILY